MNPLSLKPSCDRVCNYIHFQCIPWYITLKTTDTLPLSNVCRETDKLLVTETNITPFKGQASWGKNDVTQGQANSTSIPPDQKK